MTVDEIRSAVTETIAGTFDADPLQITDATVSNDVPGWDSLGHTVLMVRIGKRLQTRVPESIASEARNVGHLVTLLSAHMS